MNMFEDFARRWGCIIGVCDAAPLPVEKYASLSGNGGFVPFVSADVTKRTDPAASLKGVRSVVVVGVPYDKEGVPHGEGDLQVAELSSLGQNDDYHTRVKAILRALAEELQAIYGEAFRYKVLVDSSALDERAFAVRAGVGRYGRHGLVISREFGTRFNVGLLLTSVSLHDASDMTAGERSSAVCPPDCHRCITVCPNGALSLSPSGDSTQYDPSRCISYLTQKDDLTPGEKAMLHGQLYGCDICQDACPTNPPRAKTYINPARWAAMTDADFARQYGHTAMLWRGAEILRRNARIIQQGKSG